MALRKLGLEIASALAYPYKPASCSRRLNPAKSEPRLTGSSSSLVGYLLGVQVVVGSNPTDPIFQV